MLRRSALFLALAFAFKLSAQTDAKPIRVLFIGNSYTYVNNLPKLVEAMGNVQTSGPRIQTEAFLSGGKTLKWHWEQAKALEMIRQGGWDFVVLQEHSTLGKLFPAGSAPEINDPADYFEFAAKFHEEIQKTGAKTLLYATWARDGYPEQQRRLDDAFALNARKLGAFVIPAGLAWTVAKMEYPSIRLHTPDRSHPTMAGSYLNALIFYQCLTGKTVPDPPSVITGPKWEDNKPVTLVNLPASDAFVLNQIAQRVVAQEPLRPK